MSTSSLSFAEYTTIDEIIKLLIDGYIRRIQNHFDSHTNNVCYNIPKSINHICAIFYFIRNDKWDDKLKSIDGLFKIYGNVIKYEAMPKALRQTAFMSNIIEHGSYKWKFRINVFAYWGIRIGVWNLNGDEDINEILNKPRYTLGDTNYNAYIYDWRNSYLIPPKDEIYNGTGVYGKMPETGSIIEMKLDLEELTLSFVINDVDYGIAFKALKQSRYKAVICAWEGIEFEYIPEQN